MKQCITIIAAFISLCGNGFAQRYYVAGSSQWSQRAWVDSSTETWSAWVKFEGTNGVYPILCTTRGWVTDNHYRVIFYSNLTGQILFSERAGATLASSVTNLLPVPQTWYHIAAQFVGSTNRTLWINGTKCAVDTTSVSPTSIDEVFIGRFRTGIASYYTTATITETAVWSAALTDTEISQLAGDGNMAKRVSATKIRPNDIKFCPDFTIPGSAVPGIGGVTGISNAPALITTIPTAFR